MCRLAIRDPNNLGYAAESVIFLAPVLGTQGLEGVKHSLLHMCSSVLGT